MELLAQATTNSASSSSPPNSTSSITQPEAPDATVVDHSADSLPVHHFPTALRRRRSLRPRRAAASYIAPEHPKLNRLKEKADIDDELQVVDPKVKKVRIIGPKFQKADTVIDPSDPDTRRLRILADVCYDRLLALREVSSPRNDCLAREL